MWLAAIGVLLVTFFFFLCVQEMGGYFVINGKEKIVRMLIMPRRNYVSAQDGCGSCVQLLLSEAVPNDAHQPIALTRSSWKNRGPAYTEYGISISCTRKDQTFSVSVLLLWLGVCGSGVTR